MSAEDRPSKPQHRRSQGAVHAEGRESLSESSIQLAFRQSMASVCTPVSVVTAFEGSRPHGTTVSAFASLSMAPPMLLVSLDRSSDLLALITESRRFGVNVLASDQHELAINFARKGADKFGRAKWSRAYDLPRLVGAASWLACDLADLIPGGDHVIALGHVRDAVTADAAPLTYHQQIFGTHSALTSISDQEPRS